MKLKLSKKSIESFKPASNLTFSLLQLSCHSFYFSCSFLVPTYFPILFYIIKEFDFTIIVQVYDTRVYRACYQLTMYHSNSKSIYELDS